MGETAGNRCTATPVRITVRKIAAVRIGVGEITAVEMMAVEMTAVEIRGVKINGGGALPMETAAAERSRVTEVVAAVEITAVEAWWSAA